MPPSRNISPAASVPSGADNVRIRLNGGAYNALIHYTAAQAGTVQTKHRRFVKVSSSFDARVYEDNLSLLAFVQDHIEKHANTAQLFTIEAWEEVEGTIAHVKARSERNDLIFWAVAILSLGILVPCVMEMMWADNPHRVQPDIVAREMKRHRKRKGMNQRYNFVLDNNL